MKSRNGKRYLCALLLLCFALSLPGLTLAQDELKNTDPLKYKLYLNVRAQVLTVYAQDDAGDYTRIVRRMLCTSGQDLTPTPTGTYKVGGRERFGKFANFNNEYARYWTQIVRGIYTHSIMFSDRNAEELKKSPFQTLGKRASHGCIRLYVEDAKWLYYSACPGTTITIGGEEGGVTAEEKRGLRTPMTYEEYKAFQIGIYDTAELPNKTAWITSDGAPMRTGNGSNDKYIRRLPPGTPVEVLQEGIQWVKILADEREGYVKRIFITYTQGVREAYPDGRATKTTTSIYAEPNLKAKVLCRMPRDTSLDILETDPEAGWFKIRYWDVEGYIRIRNTRTDLSMYPYNEEAQLAAYLARTQAAADSSAAIAASSAVLSSGVVPSQGMIPSGGIVSSNAVLASDAAIAALASASAEAENAALTREELEADALTDGET